MGDYHANDFCEFTGSGCETFPSVLDGLGYEINEQFSDETVISVILAENIFLMMMEMSRFSGFAPRPVADARSTTESLFALNLDSREAVDAMKRAFVEYGGQDENKNKDRGYTYSNSLSDPDGHVFEYVWVDMEAFEAAQARNE